MISPDAMTRWHRTSITHDRGEGVDMRAVAGIIPELIVELL